MLRVLLDSWEWPLPLEEASTDNQICSNSTLLDLHLCSPQQVSYYYKYMLLTDNPEKIPGTPQCPAGSTDRPACSPGFFNEILDGSSEPFRDHQLPVACCAGYFCPSSLTCLVPCPLGAYCPKATPSKAPPGYDDGGLDWCAPYAYRVRSHLGCGGADRWTLIPEPAFPGFDWEAGSGGIYCNGGSYCPNTTSTVQCPRKRFCRRGTVYPERCPIGANCYQSGIEIPSENYTGISIDILLIILVGIIWQASSLVGNLVVRRRKSVAEAQKRQLTGGEASNEYTPLLAASSPAFPHQHAAKIEFRHLRVQLHKDNDRMSERFILRDASGLIQPARLTAILGPSGSGKTTLLNILAGRVAKTRYYSVKGSVLLDDSPVKMYRYNRILGFVPQDDIVHSLLTVEENLLFSAQYRLPLSCTRRHHIWIVEHAIHLLGLENVATNIVGDSATQAISGGQRKRVNVGIELVAKPSLLLADEPTSGLDATATRSLISNLRDIAHTEGVSITAVLHQPSLLAWEMLDDIILLAPGGGTVYSGPRSVVSAHFQSLGYELPPRINPADALLDIVSRLEENGQPLSVLESREHEDGGVEENGATPLSVREFMRVLVQKYRSACVELWQDVLLRPFRKVHMDQDRSRRTPGFLRHYWLCLARAWTQRHREPLAIFSDFALVAVTGTTVGLLSDRGKATIMHFAISSTYSVVAVGLMSSVGAVSTFGGDERLTFGREAASGLNVLAYFAALDFHDLLGLALRCSVYLASWYAFAAPRAVVWQIYVMTFGIAYCGSGAGYLISQIAEGTGSAQLACAVLALLQGLLARQDGLSPVLKAAQFMSFARWGLEGITIAESNRLTGVWLLARCADLQGLGYDVRRFTTCIVALFVLGACFRGLAVAALVRKLG